MSNWKVKGKLKKKNIRDRDEEIISLLLKNRGITAKKAKENFFKPENPLNLSISTLDIDNKEISKAVKRIHKAQKDDETIIVYGDYDADGICGTAILWEVLHDFQKKVMPYLPHRIEEGYGLSKKGIDALIAELNPKLIITVDQGVTALEEIEYAKEKGIDVIVSDHHVIPKEKPKPFALIHSTKISGASVSWFLARELLKKTHKPKTDLAEKLSLAAIGTISDVLPLLDFNRAIVIHGLEQLRITKRPGLKALFQEAGISAQDLDSYHISYIIGPRINSSGRLTHAIDSLRLLCTKSYSRAYELARTLGFTNRERQKITESTLIHARSYVEKIYKKGKTKLLFVSHASYNQGIIGLVAGKLAEQYYLPAIVISQGEIFSKASARSISGFNIISAIRQSSELLVDCGGHPMAAGFTVETAKITQLKKNLEEIVEKQLDKDLLVKTLNVDCEINFSNITSSLFEKINKFKPFGLGNPEPLFATYDLQIVEARLVGRGMNHLKLRVRDEQNKEFSAIAFGKGDLYPKLTKESKIDLVYTLTKNNWNGEQIELKVRDILLD